jgi:peptidoglycan/LPS O-acetylase OafA/YrhL
LRGLAVLAVMGSHLFPGTTRSPITQAIGSTLSFGAAGVDLFFVLSGFLITGILYDSLQDSGYFRKFYARRMLRIFPLYYAVVFTYIALTPLLGIQWHGMHWALLFYLQNTNIAGPFYTFGILDHFWSLAVEEQFYLVWPLIVFFVRDIRRLLWVCLALSSVSLVLRLTLAFHHAIYHTINRSTLCRMDSLLVGGALALALRGGLHDRVLRAAKPLFWSAVVAIAGLNLLRPALSQRPQLLPAFDATYLGVRYTLLALASAALIGWCLQPSSLRRFFEGKALRFFGKYSYGLYVLHLIALGYLLRTFRGWISVVTPNKGVGVVGAGLMVFVLAVAAAYTSYHLYEKQFLRLKRYFDYDRTRRTERIAVLS